MSAGAVVATTTPAPKRHGFSIESLIGLRDDSPVRRPSVGVVGGSANTRVLEDSHFHNHSHRPRSRGSVFSHPNFRSSAVDAGEISPSSTDDERTHTRVSSPPSPASPITSPRLEKSSSSPETENRFAAYEDFKHMLGAAGAFHHIAAHGGGGQLPGVDGSSLYPPLRVCNRSLSAAMNSAAAAAALMPHQFAGLPVNPSFLYNLHRDLAAHHPSHHPLLAARYPGFGHPRYPMGPGPGLLFHPYRKPKRNRTAFSPNQLLQLEQAFEKNHYVVGQERKSLASKLQLTETQVKVWFQNRRTKHKRMKAEEEATGGVTSGDDGKLGAGSDAAHSDAKSDASEHDIEEDMCLSDEEELSVTEDC